MLAGPSLVIDIYQNCERKILNNLIVRVVYFKLYLNEVYVTACLKVVAMSTAFITLSFVSLCFHRQNKFWVFYYALDEECCFFCFVFLHGWNFFYFKKVQESKLLQLLDIFFLQLLFKHWSMLRSRYLCKIMTLFK